MTYIVQMAEPVVVVMRSGDALVFEGSKSSFILHGVEGIDPGTAPPHFSTARAADSKARDSRGRDAVTRGAASARKGKSKRRAQDGPENGYGLTGHRVSIQVRMKYVLSLDQSGGGGASVPVSAPAAQVS